MGTTTNSGTGTAPVLPCSFKLDAVLVQDLDQIASQDHRNRSATVRLALTEFVKQRKAAAKRKKSEGSR